MGVKQRRKLAESLAPVPRDEPRVILATGSYLGEGFDDARLDTLLLATADSWKGTLQTIRGPPASPPREQERGPGLRLRGCIGPHAGPHV